VYYENSIAPAETQSIALKIYHAFKNGGEVPTWGHPTLYTCDVFASFCKTQSLASLQDTQFYKVLESALLGTVKAIVIVAATNSKKT
jgi:hypothetical protein